MRALITGSAGFIGSAALKHFSGLHPDWDIVGVDIDVDCRTVFASDDRFDLVLHFAAIVGGRANIDGNPLAVAESIELDAAMFRWAERTKPARIVYPSSSAAYPVKYQGKAGASNLSEHFIDLENPELPDAMYGWVKLTGEKLAAASSIPTLILRPMSGYGASQDTSYPFGKFLERTRRRDAKFQIWGTGTQIRDWVHISDILGFITAALEQDITGPYNVGTGVPTSFYQLADLFTRRAGYSPIIEPLPDMPTGVLYRVADTRKMKQVYEPRITLSEGIARAIEGEPGW